MTSITFPALDSAEKVKVLTSALKELSSEIYKNLSKLGHDPDTYSWSSWNFDPLSTNLEDDPDYHTKKALTIDISRASLMSAKITELS